MGVRFTRFEPFYALLLADSFSDPPQLEQKTAFSSTEAPHLEQYFMAFLLFLVVLMGSGPSVRRSGGSVNRSEPGLAQ